MHQFGFSVWGYTTIRSKNKNKQIKTFQVVLLTPWAELGACVCVGGGGGSGSGVPIPLITYPCVG